MIEEKKAERIIDNLGKYLGLHARYDNGVIYAILESTYNAWILKTITRHYNVRSYIKTDKHLIKSFELVVFQK